MPAEQSIEPGAFETIAAAMTPPEPTIQPIDHAEELMALKSYYEARTIGLRGALRRETEKNAELRKINDELSAQLADAKKGMEELREEFAELSAKSGKAH
jgi:predicted nuclease with TOPRIM domain